MIDRKSERDGVDSKFRGLKLFLVVLVSLIVLFWWMRQREASVWSGDLNYRSVIVGREGSLTLVLVEPNGERSVTWKIPGEMLVPVVGSGEVKASSLWKFASGEGEPEAIIARSIESWLGISVEAVWEDSSRGVLAMIRGIWQPGWFDRWRFQEAISKVKPGLTEELVLPVAATQSERWPDGQEVRRVDLLLIEPWVRDYWGDELLLDEFVGVRLVNRSGEPGAARVAERIVDRAGLRVVDVSAEGEAYEGWCRYYMPREGGELAEAWLKKRLGCVSSGTASDSEINVVVEMGTEWGKGYL